MMFCVSEKSLFPQKCNKSAMHDVNLTLFTQITLEHYIPENITSQNSSLCDFNLFSACTLNTTYFLYKTEKLSPLLKALLFNSRF